MAEDPNPRIVWYPTLPSILITIGVPEDDGPPVSGGAASAARADPALQTIRITIASAMQTGDGIPGRMAVGLFFPDDWVEDSGMEITDANPELGNVSLLRIGLALVRSRPDLGATTRWTRSFNHLPRSSAVRTRGVRSQSFQIIYETIECRRTHV